MKKLVSFFNVLFVFLLFNSCVSQVQQVEVHPSNLEITQLPTKLDYKINEYIDYTGLSVKLNYTDGSSKTLALKDMTLEPKAGSILKTVGSNPIKITSNEKTVFFLINVSEDQEPLYSASLEIASLPTTLNYFTNEKLDLTGLVVKMNKTDGSQVTLSESEYTVEPSNGSVLTEEGNHAIKVSSNGKTVYFMISVSDNQNLLYSTSLEIASLPTTLNYFTNGKLDLTGLVVKMNKTDGSQVTLSESEYTVEPSNGSVLTEEGCHAIKVVAEGRTACFFISVAKEAKPVGLEIAKLPDVLNYLPDQNLDLSGLIVKKNLSDGTSVTLSDSEYTTEPEVGTLLSEVGTQPIKIIFENKSVFFTVNVSDTILTGIEITSYPLKIDYEDGEAFDSEGLGISAIYASNDSSTSKVLSANQYNINLEDGDSLESGKDFKVVINYYGKATSYIIHIGAKTSESYEFLDDGSHTLPAICKENENLKRVVIPESIQEIYEYAFDGCTNLESISLPTSLNKIEKYAFRNCAKLTELLIPDSVSTISEYAFDGCGFSEIELPHSLIQLLKGTFQNCESLERIKLNDSLNLIAKMSFNNCKSLKEIVWSNSVEIIGLAAFYECSSLEELILPSSLKEIHVNVSDCGYVKDFIPKISYTGTIEEFNTISIIGNYLQGATIYCSDGSFVYGE